MMETHKLANRGNHWSLISPIFNSGVEKMNPLISLLNEITEHNFLLKALNNNEIKVQPKTVITYTEIIKALEKHREKMQFHSYNSKHERSFRVVLKHLHYSTDNKEINQSIELLGHEILNIWNIKQNKTKNSFSMFFYRFKTKRKQ